MEQTEDMMAAAWMTARLPPEMLPRTVVTTVVVVTAGENKGVGARAIFSRSDPQKVSEPEFKRSSDVEL